MIDLTPLEVRQKKHDFRRSFRGYDVELVNDFLDLVADRMEELVKDNLRLRDRVESLDRDLDEYRRKEKALSDALMTAQRLQEDAREHAEREADLLVREARAEAEAVRQESDRALIREQQTLRQVSSRRAQMVASFRELLRREIAELDIIEDTLALQAASTEQLQLPGTQPTGAGAFERSQAVESGTRPEQAGEDWDVDWEGEVETGATEAQPRGPRPVREDAPAASASGTPDAGTGQADTNEDEDWLSSLREGLERE